MPRTYPGRHPATLSAVGISPADRLKPLLESMASPSTPLSLDERGATMPKAKSVQADQALELYRTGWKLVDIAKELNVPPGTIRRWKCVYEWDAFPETDAQKRAAAKRAKLILDLIQNGWRQTDIAEALGISASTVRRWKSIYLKDEEPGMNKRNAPLSVSPDAQREYCRAYYRQKQVHQRLYSLIRSNFQRAALLTFCFQPAAPMPWKFVSKYLRSYDGSAQLRLRQMFGINYEFVRLAEYIDFDAGTMQFRYITDLTAEQCELVAADWIMGEAKIEELSMEDLEETLSPINARESFLQKDERYRRGWSYTRGLKR